jgi:hypothetical protein
MIGQNPALGSPTGQVGVAGPVPYVSGVNENADAAPVVIFAGDLFRDMRIFSRPDGPGLVPGGYANQDFGFVSNQQTTADLAPATMANNNIVTAQASSTGVPMTLAGASTGITVIPTGGFIVPGLVNIIPANALQIDAAPGYVGYGTSGAVRGWSGAAVGRCLQLQSAANLSGIVYTVRGFDLYGFPQTEAITGPNITTVYGSKGWKWITSVTPNGTNAGTLNVGTADVFEFPLRADRFYQTWVVWNNVPELAPTVGGGHGAARTWLPADTTSPATSVTGSPRGTYVSADASNGVKRLQIIQTIPPALIASVVGVFGVTPA